MLVYANAFRLKEDAATRALGSLHAPSHEVGRMQS